MTPVYRIETTNKKKNMSIQFKQFTYVYFKPLKTLKLYKHQHPQMMW